MSPLQRGYVLGALSRSGCGDPAAGQCTCSSCAKQFEEALDRMPAFKVDALNERERELALQWHARGEAEADES